MGNVFFLFENSAIQNEVSKCKVNIKSLFTFDTLAFKVNNNNIDPTILRYQHHTF